MGVQVRIVAYAPDALAAERAARAAFARIAALEDLLSDYRPTSELMRLCARAGGRPVAVSPELFFVLARAQEMARRSDGAFDVTVGPLVALWRRARRSGALPTLRELRAARALVGWRKVRLDPSKRTVQLLTPGMQLDRAGSRRGTRATRRSACCAKTASHSPWSKRAATSRFRARRRANAAGRSRSSAPPPPGNPDA
jgi:thiamine biosynthesis lipoprotein